MQKLGGSPSPAQALLIRDSDVRAHRTGDVGVHPNALTRPSVMREGGEELLPVIMQRETIVQNLGRTLRLLSLRRQKESAVTLDPVPRCRATADAPEPRVFLTGGFDFAQADVGPHERFPKHRRRLHFY